jgi:sugar phosphate isomerase/epimerase
LQFRIEGFFMMIISFMTANYVARQIGYQMTGGWMQGDTASQNYFKPVKTFGKRFEAYLSDIRAMGFTAVDIWTGILHPAWAKDDHIDTANELLAQYDLPVMSLAGGFGANEEAFEAACELAVALNTSVLAGGTPLLKQNRALTIAILQKYGLRLGIENHAEKTPEDMLAQIGDGGGGVIGTAVDTGWYGTQGYDAAKAIEKLGQHIFAVHLKDVLKPGAHDTCRFGAGCVPIKACVETLKRIGYESSVCVEHEPEDGDPTEDCIACLAMLKEWLA